jgi:hypothetical protein
MRSDKLIVSEFYTSLIAACNKYVGMKLRYPQNRLIKSDAPSLEIEHQSGGTKTSKVAATTSGSASAQDSGIPKVGTEVKEEADVGQGNANNTAQDLADQLMNQGNGRGWSCHGGTSGGDYKQSFFKSWPEGKNYLNKFGNQVTKEFEEWFHRHCYKCESHSA